jgi:Mg-chelatase subunit ChlD
MNNTNVRFVNPWLLLIGVALLGLCIGGFFLIPKQKRRRPKNIISLSIHVVMSILLGFAFADLQFKVSDSHIETWIVADCSDSEVTPTTVNGKSTYDTTALDNTIKQVYNEANGNNNVSVGVIAFGKDAKVITPLGRKFDSVSSVYKGDDDFRSGSNIENALKFADTQFSSSAVRKIVLVSDGQETDGSAINAIDSLLADGVSVDAVSVSSVQGDEVAITGVEYTDSCFVGREENAKVSIRSTKQIASAKVTLTPAGGTPIERTIGLGRGITIVNFPLDSSKEGSIDYQVTVSGTDDSYTQNNTWKFTQTYSTVRKTLFVGSDDSQYQNFLTVSGFAKDTVTECILPKNDLPYTFEDMAQYDQFVLSDVDLLNQTNDHYNEFIPNLDKLVNYYGKSLMTFGATYSGLSASKITDANTYINEYNNMLPVQFQSDGSKAVCLLIDNSGSMDSDNRMTKAKQGAIACLDILSEKDYISIVTFSDTGKTVQALTSVKNKDQVRRSINKIKSEGGTEIIPGLKAASNQIADSKCDYKSIIILSDGDPFEQENTIMRQVRNIVKKDVSISCINISNNSSSAINLLKKIAREGNGSYFYCRTSASLIQTMTSSVAEEITNQTAEDKDYTINVQEDQTDNVVLKDVNTAQLGSVSGFNICRVRRVANTVLTVTYVKEEQNESGESTDPISRTVTVPLLAYWSYGKGTVTSFASSLAASTKSGKDWTEALRASESGQQLFNNMCVQNLPERKALSSLDLSYTSNGSTSTLNVMADTSDPTATVTATVTDANGNTAEPVKLYYNGTYFSGEVATGKDEKYTVVLNYTSSDGKTTITSPAYTIYFNYSKEYDIFTNSDNNVLSNLITAAKKSSSDASLFSYYPNGSYRWTSSESMLAHLSWYSTMIWFILVSVILFLIDIFVRKSDFKKKITKQTTLSAPTMK